MTAATIVDARLSGARSQQIYDLLLRTLSRPGIVRALPSWCDASVPPAAWPALALADVDVVIASDDPDLAGLIADATRAPIGDFDTAWVLAALAPSLDQIASIERGSALAPEHGARLGLAVESLSARPNGAPGELTLRLSGPGVDGSVEVTSVGLPAGLAERLGSASGHFPTGFDTWLCAPDGIAAIPRTTTVELCATPAAHGKD